MVYSSIKMESAAKKSEYLRFGRRVMRDLQKCRNVPLEAETKTIHFMIFPITLYKKTGEN